MKILIAFLLCISSIFAEESYQFHGVHFLASYSKCDRKALSDVEALKQVIHKATLASGATILNTTSHLFPPHGLTIVLLLSESHASLHTYPEHGACFVDLFTCGVRCSYEAFDAVLRQYLKPEEIQTRVLYRHEGIDDLSR